MSKRRKKSLGYNLFFNMDNPKDFNWVLNKENGKFIHKNKKRNTQL